GPVRASSRYSPDGRPAAFGGECRRLFGATRTDHDLTHDLGTDVSGVVGFLRTAVLEEEVCAFRKGYSRCRVSTTFRCAGVLGGTTTPQRWHRYNRDSLPLGSRGG